MRCAAALFFLSVSLSGQVLPIGSIPVNAGTFTLLHVTAPVTTAACSLTCTITVTGTTAGSLQVITATDNGSSQAYVSGTSGAGNWSCPVAQFLNPIGGVSGCYNVNSTAGVTTLTLTSSVSGATFNVRQWEYTFTGGPVSLDTSGNNTTSVGSTTQLGGAVALGGSNRLIVQWVVSSSQAASSISAPYGNFVSQGASTDSAYADLENTSSGTAPTWTFPTSQTIAAGAMAFRLGAQTITVLPTTCLGDQAGTLSGSVSCTWSPFAPAAGSNLVCGGDTFNGGSAVTGLSISDGTTFTNSQAARDYTSGGNRWILLSYRFSIGVTAPATVTMTINGTDMFANLVCNAFTDSKGTPTPDGTCTFGTTSTPSPTMSCTSAIMTSGVDYVVAIGATSGLFADPAQATAWSNGARVKGSTTIYQIRAGNLTPSFNVQTGQNSGIDGFAIDP